MIVIPSSFLQLYTISILLEKSSLACAYLLMANKAADTYTRAFASLRIHLNVGNYQGPVSVMLDFEQSKRVYS
jgi:hypothetical protein